MSGSKQKQDIEYYKKLYKKEKKRVAQIHGLLNQRIESLQEGYNERNKLVAVLTKVWPSHIEYHNTKAPDYDENFKHIVIINTPKGQASFHIHNIELDMFKHLDILTENKWDGHTTEEKYKRLLKIKKQY